MEISIYILDLLVIGSLLLAVTLGSGLITRLPLSFALIYLIVGIMLGPYGAGLIQLQARTEFMERITEMVVIISLYSCGLKMNRPLKAWVWNSTIRLIGFLMPISIFAVAALGHWFLGFSWASAILLGAILAPTDPVLASEVQLAHPDDKDELRFGLTSEGGLNDALAFPFVYFGLYWLKDSNLDNWFRNWVAIDLLWAIAAGIVMGIVVGRAITWITKRLQRREEIDEEMEDFIALATILIVYSLTELVNGYGFLAVFVSGIVVARTSPGGQRMSQLQFSSRIERLLEVGTILLLGTLLRVEPMVEYAGATLLIAGALIFLIRPIGAWISTIGDPLHPGTRWLFGWFGIRGVGSLYYLAYAFREGIPEATGEAIGWITYSTIIISVVIHGITATPLMNWYERHIGESRMEKLARDQEDLPQVDPGEPQTDEVHPRR